jgi:FKBP-type peptidyl-prolyl cis-trans isomerase 2
MVTETAAAPLVPRQVTVPAGALSEGTVEEGDIANIDFCASADGMAVSGVSAENFNVMIGSGTLGTELEQELLGAEIGEVVTISVSYPGNYRSEVLAGKDVVYEVVVNYIYRLSQMTPEPETGTETETQVTETETETQVAETEIETETQVAETEIETQAAETETETETQAAETEIETQAAETETETETQVTETETEAQAAGDMYGMLAETVSEEESAKFRMPSGAYLISVDPQSAAGLAGLLAGDVITGIDRASVNSAEFMNMLLSSYAEGEEAVIRYQRLDGGSYKEYIAKMTLLKEVDDTILQGQTETQDTEKLQSENGQHAEGPGTSQGSTQQHAEGPGTSQAGTQQHAEGPGTSQADTQQHTTDQQDDTQQHTVNPQISQVIVGNTGSAQWQQSGPTVLDEYIFPDVDSRYLTDSEISLLTLQQVCYAKNEVYAIHGRQFVSVELQQYFGSKSWYYGFIAPSDFSDSVFNDIEKANIQKLVNRENALSGGAGYKLDQPGYDISLAGTASLK